jgi:hypothetical protein
VTQIALVRVDGTHGRHDLRPRRLLEHIALRACLESAVDVLRARMLALKILSGSLDLTAQGKRH